MLHSFNKRGFLLRKSFIASSMLDIFSLNLCIRPFNESKRLWHSLHSINMFSSEYATSGGAFKGVFSNKEPSKSLANSNFSDAPKALRALRFHFGYMGFYCHSLRIIPRVSGIIKLNRSTRSLHCLLEVIFADISIRDRFMTSLKGIPLRGVNSKMKRSISEVPLSFQCTGFLILA